MAPLSRRRRSTPAAASSGGPLELIVYDGKSDVPTIASITQRMVEEDQVVALVGLTDTSYMRAAGPVAQENQIPFLDVGGTAPIITQIGDYIFMLPFGDNVQAAAAAEYVAEQGWTTCAMLVDEAMDYTKFLARYFDQAFTALGGEIVSRLAYNMGDTDFSAQITEFANLDPQPDFYFISANPGEIGTIVAQARAAGLSAPIVGGDGYDTPLLTELGGQSTPVNDVVFTTHQGIYDDTPAAAAFIAAYEAEYGRPPENVFAALGYDGVNLMVDAMERAGTTDGPAVRDALNATTDFQGVTGTISYADGTRIPAKSVALIEVVDNENQLIEVVVRRTSHPRSGRAERSRRIEDRSGGGVACPVVGLLSPLRYGLSASVRAAPSKTFAPASMSSGVEYSASEWLRPPSERTKIIPAGQNSWAYLASWPAPDQRRRVEMPSSSAAAWTATTTSGAKGVGSLVQKRSTETSTWRRSASWAARACSRLMSMSRVAGSRWRKSTEQTTLPGMVLIVFGSAAIRPTVPTAPETSRAIRSTPATTRAAAARASRRSGIGEGSGVVGVAGHGHLRPR
jgi:branched-chain amino acid transport system substrate-binding protein